MPPGGHIIKYFIKVRLTNNGGIIVKSTSKLQEYIKKNNNSV